MSVIINGDTGVSGVNGSAATPSLQGTDTNTGIFYPAADTIAFAEGGVEAMRINASGNVGIGTTTPPANGRLSVYGGRTYLAANSETYSLALQYASGTGQYYIGATNSADPSLVFSNVSGTERMRIDSSGYVTNAVNGLGNGIVQAQQYYRLNSGFAGSNATGAQSLFGVGVTLIGSTQYEFELNFLLGKTAGTTSHTISLGFGGTATLNNIEYNGLQLSQTTLGFNTGANGIISTAASATVATGAITSATQYVGWTLKGIVSINAGGTFIPQYTLSAAPGGAYTTQIGSYMKITPLAASGANVSIGTWA